MRIGDGVRLKRLLIGLFFAFVIGAIVAGVFVRNAMDLESARIANQAASFSHAVSGMMRDEANGLTAKDVRVIESFLVGAEFDCVWIEEDERTILSWPRDCSDRDVEYDEDVLIRLMPDPGIAVTFTIDKTRLFEGVVSEFLLVVAALATLIATGFTLFLLWDRRETTRRGVVQEGEAARLRAMINASLDAVVTMDEGGICQEFNAAAERMFGYRREEVLGRELGGLIVPPNLRSAHSEGIARLKRTGQSKIVGKRLELAAVRADGEVFPTEMIIEALDLAAGRIFVSFIRDVSAERKSAREREEAREQAEAGSLAKSDFLATMSHEIRTPLNGIIGVLGLLRGTKLTSEQAEYIRVGGTSSEHLLQLVNDVLDFSKLEAGKLELDLSEFCLSDAVTNVVDVLRGEVERKGLDLRVDLGDIGQSTIVGDDGRLQQILINIVGNAVKFTDKGSVSLSVAKEMSTSVSEGALLFTISDTGPGVPIEKQGILFEKFATGSDIDRGKVEGAGLGLAISKTLVELMGGTISFESKLDDGATFWFSIPLHERSSLPGPPAERADSSGADLIVMPCRILLAEDNTTNSMIARVILEKAGHLVDTVVDGNEAIGAIANHEYDIVFMDVSMPGLSGTEATRVIRANEVGDVHIPIVALTAHVLAEKRQQLFDAGMDDFLAKPVTSQALNEMVAKWQGDEVQIREFGTPENSPQDTSDTERVFDQDTLRRLLEDTSPAAFIDLVSSFEENVERQVKNILAAIEDEDLGALEHETHTLSGSAGTFGGNALFQICRYVEVRCENGDQEGAVTAAKKIQLIAAKTLIRVSESAAMLSAGS